MICSDSSDSCTTFPQQTPKKCPNYGPILLEEGGVIEFDHVGFEWVTVNWKRVSNATTANSRWRTARMSVFPLVSLVKDKALNTLSPLALASLNESRRVTFINCQFVQPTQNRPFASFRFQSDGGFAITLSETKISPPLFLNATQFLYTSHNQCVQDKGNCTVSVASESLEALPVLPLQRLQLPTVDASADPMRLHFQSLKLQLRVGGTCAIDWQGWTGSLEPSTCESLYNDTASCNRKRGCSWVPGVQSPQTLQQAPRLRLSYVELPSLDPDMEAGAVAGEMWRGLTRCGGEAAPWCVASMANVTMHDVEDLAPWAELQLDATDDEITLMLLRDSPRNFRFPINLHGGKGSKLEIRGQQPAAACGSLPLLYMDWVGLNKSCPGIAGVTGVRLRPTSTENCTGNWSLCQSSNATSKCFLNGTQLGSVCQA